MVNGLLGHHGAHIRPTGGIANHGGAAANQGDGLVSGHLQPLHQAQRHEVTHMEGVGGGVKTDVEGGFAVVNHLADFFFIGHLGNQTTGNQFIIHFHLFKFLSYCAVQPQMSFFKTAHRVFTLVSSSRVSLGV